MTNPRPRVAVVQDGARLHYLLPLAMHRAGLLERVFTEFYAPPGSPEATSGNLIARIRPGLARRMALRYCAELPIDRVVRNPWLLLPEQCARIGATHAEVYFRRCTDLVGRWIRRVGLGNADTLVGFVRNVDPLLCRFAKRRGLTVIGDQMIAPAAVEEREHRKQTKRWPNWELTNALLSVCDLERETWAACDHLTAPSDFVREGLIAEGVDPSRISVLPYPVASEWFQPVDRSGRTGPLTVGFIGSVNLRKGAPYFFEVARKLERQLRFVMVGPIHLRTEAVEKHKGQVEVVGSKPRETVARMLDQFDMLFFPSTCEGSAGSVMEAMMAGLPVVCSPNTGSVVRDGIDGFIVPYDDTDRAAECLMTMAGDHDRRLTMGHSARSRAETFDIACYSQLWLSTFERLVTHSRAPAA
jgi:glycosyltransferase involved in cell wall biosynthesis